MASRYVYDSIAAWLTANWAETRIIDPINFYAGTEFATDPLEESIVLLEEESIEEPQSLGAPGANCSRERGTFSVAIFVPSGTGSARSRELAEMIRALFRDQIIDDGQGGEMIHIESVDPPSESFTNPGGGSIGDWYGIEVGIDYYCDFFR